MNNFTPRAQQVLALARKEADRFNHNFVGTEHLLLGLLREEKCLAAEILNGRGLNLSKIREELGVSVPLPDDGHSLSQALIKAVLLRKHERDGKRQQTFSFVELEEAKAIETRWRDAAEKAKKNRTVFAQRRLKPEDVLPEWKKSLAALGGKEDVQRFTGRALARLGGALEPIGTSGRRGP